MRTAMSQIKGFLVDPNNQIKRAVEGSTACALWSTLVAHTVDMIAIEICTTKFLVVLDDEGLLRDGAAFSHIVGDEGETLTLAGSLLFFRATEDGDVESVTDEDVANLSAHGVINWVSREFFDRRVEHRMSSAMAWWVARGESVRVLPGGYSFVVLPREQK